MHRSLASAGMGSWAQAKEELEVLRFYNESVYGMTALKKLRDECFFRDLPMKGIKLEVPSVRPPRRAPG